MSARLPRLDFLEFETAHLSGRVYRLSPGEDCAPDAREIRDVLARADAPLLVSCRIPAQNEPLAETLSASGFVQVETLVTLAAALPGSAPMPETVRPARPEDSQSLVEIASRTFLHDRFHVDNRLPRSAADRLKAAWVANGLAGRADKALCALDRDGRPAGFVLCRRADRPAIDLVGVSPEAQGKGLGRALVRGAVSAYAGQAPEILVSTQEANKASLGLYRSEGFTIVKREKTFHWRPPCAESAAKF